MLGEAGGVVVQAVERRLFLFGFGRLFGRFFLRFPSFLSSVDLATWQETRRCAPPRVAIRPTAGTRRAVPIVSRRLTDTNILLLSKSLRAATLKLNRTSKEAVVRRRLKPVDIFPAWFSFFPLLPKSHGGVVRKQ